MEAKVYLLTDFDGFVGDASKEISSWRWYLHGRDRHRLSVVTGNIADALHAERLIA